VASAGAGCGWVQHRPMRRRMSARRAEGERGYLVLWRGGAGQIAKPAHRFRAAGERRRPRAGPPRGTRECRRTRRTDSGDRCHRRKHVASHFKSKLLHTRATIAPDNMGGDIAFMLANIIPKLSPNRKYRSSSSGPRCPIPEAEGDQRAGKALSSGACTLSPRMHVYWIACSIRGPAWARRGGDPAGQHLQGVLDCTSRAFI
jgi:hypothetical protein